MNSDTIQIDTATSQDRGGLILPECTVPDRREIFRSRGVSVYCDREAPAGWPEHAHSQLELTLLSEEAVCDFRWQQETGKWCGQSLSGAQICVIAPDVVHACKWKNAADKILLYVDPSVWPEALRATVQDVWMGAFSEVAGHDLIIWELARSLRELCRETDQPDGPHVETIGAVLATRLVTALIKARTDRKSSKAASRRISWNDQSEAKRNLREILVVLERYVE